MGDDKPTEVDPTAALLGVPTGEETLSRDNVDELEFSARQEKRPAGMSRDDYMSSGPGPETRAFMALAGVRRRQIAAAVGLTLLMAAAGAVVWFFVLSS